MSRIVAVVVAKVAVVAAIAVGNAVDGERNDRSA
jgi:hypothetical protein